MSKRRFYKTKIEVTVLSEEPYEFRALEGLAHDITYGDCVGVVSDQAPVRISRKQVVKELYDAGSEPEFFMLDKNGKDKT